LATPLTNYSVIVVRVQFSDKAFATDTATAADFFQKVQDYYKENSFDVFVPTFTLSPVISLPRSEASYGQNCGEDYACKVPLLISESISQAEPFVDFTAFDQVMIYHAGTGEESETGVAAPNTIWSLFFPSSEMSFYGYAPIRGDGKPFDGATIVPEKERGASALGVICHEYGHQLGLPDLYDTSNGLSTVGAWDLMDYPWTGSPVGSNPPHLGAWSKRFLGFGSTEVMGSSGTVSFSPNELPPGKSMEVYRSGAEYFLVEYRLAGAGVYDSSFPQSAGLAVWHVDENVLNDTPTFNGNRVNAASVNSFHHNGIDLVEANGKPANPGNFANWSGDVFTEGQTLSTPASNLFNGAVSSLVMTGISGVGAGTVSGQILFLGAKTNQGVARAISYPNPSTGQVRIGAPAGTWSTLRLQLSRPVAPSSLKATLFTIAGERVQEIPGAGFVFQSDLSRDYEWVYEYNWNGRDETGAEVASGVYYLLFNVDGEKIRKTIVVQR
jgi:M6 family metalloprotease-like protein